MGKFVNYTVNNGQENMRIDEQLLNLAIDNGLPNPILRFYGWSPMCLSLGRNQGPDGINWDYCHQNYITVVQRLTGGKAILHDKELTYSFICPQKYLPEGESVIATYKHISGALRTGFKLLDIEVMFPINKKPDVKHDYCMLINTKADLCCQNRKLVGSAQFRKQNYILQHGSILIDYDRNVLNSVFTENIDETSLITIKEINPRLDISDLCSAIKLGFEKYFDTKFVE